MLELTKRLWILLFFSDSKMGSILNTHLLSVSGIMSAERCQVKCSARHSPAVGSREAVQRGNMECVQWPDYVLKEDPPKDFT